MRRILLIEDEAIIREDLAEFLTEEGYTALQAKDGVEGLEAIVSNQPDLVLCDINMPLKNGHDVLRELRGDHPELSHIPFIFLTAYSGLENLTQGLDRGADDYLTKPVDYDILLAKVGAALHQMERVSGQQEIEKDQARLQTLQTTMATVHDVVNNFLQSLLLFRLEAEKSQALSEESLKLFDGLVSDTSSKLKTIADLESVVEKSADSGITTLDLSPDP